MGTDDTDDAADLFCITILSRGQFLRVMLGKPGLLAIIRTLARHLKVEPLELEILLRGRRVVNLALLVVCFDEVLEDSTGLQGITSENSVTDKLGKHNGSPLQG